jgi:Tol biopolymer transport system component
MSMVPIRSACVAVALLVVGGCADSDRPGASGVPAFEELSPPTARHQWPTPSPDGTRLAFWALDSASNVGGWRMMLATADLREVTATEVTTTLTQFPPLWSPDGERIAVTSNRGGNIDVYVYEVGTGALTQLTDAPGLKGAVSWRADGRELAIVQASGTAIAGRIIDLVTKASRAGTSDTSPIAITFPSADWSQRAVYRCNGGRCTLAVEDSAGNSRVLTTEGFEEPPAFLPWSPDGRELLFLSRRSGAPDLWVAPVDGSPARQLTSDVRTDEMGVWSPDGRWVAFRSDRGRQSDLWIVPASGGEARRVTDDADLEQNPPIWSPDGKTLYYQVESSSDRVIVVDGATGRERDLLDAPQRVSSIRLSPDGQAVAYVRIDAGGDAELRVVPVAGGDSRLLTTGRYIRNLRWSPDAASIAFDAQTRGSADIFVADVATGTTRVVVDWPDSWENSAVWVDGGRGLMFVSERESRLADLWVLTLADSSVRRLTRDQSVGLLFEQLTDGDVLALSLSPAVQDALLRVSPDGTVRPIWDRSTFVDAAWTPDGRWLAVLADSAPGQRAVYLRGPQDREFRRILGGEFVPGMFNADGSRLVLNRLEGAATTTWDYDVATGTLRQVTKTTDREFSARPTPDGGVVVGRSATTSRIRRVDVRGVIADPPR